MAIAPKKKYIKMNIEISNNLLSKSILILIANFKSSLEECCISYVPV